MLLIVLALFCVGYLICPQIHFNLLFSQRELREISIRTP